jgi:RNA polymerase sigma-70 factor (ECF subfamily)
LNINWNRDVRRVHQALAGDLAAAEGLVRDYYPKVFRFLAHLTGSRADAEELTQETFYKAWRSLRQFSGRSTFGTWLLSIAYREAIAYRARNNTVPLQDDAHDATQDFVQPLLSAVLVEKALNQLPEDLRATYLLHVEQGLSVQEVAGILGIPKGTVLSRLANCRERLKRQLSMREIASATAVRMDPKVTKRVTTYEAT